MAHLVYPFGALCRTNNAARPDPTLTLCPYNFPVFAHASGSITCLPGGHDYCARFLHNPAGAQERQLPPEKNQLGMKT
jgi:hypothetical protein